MIETINIEMDFDKNRVAYASFAMYQILATLEEGYNIDFYLINEGIEDYSFVDKLQSLFPEKLHSYSYVDFNDFLSNTSLYKVNYGNTIVPKLVCSRFYVPKMFPELKGRYIHIDDDILMRKSISEFWNLDKDAPLLGTLSYTDNAKHFFDVEQKMYKPNDPWMNTGVIIIDIDYFNNNKVFDKFAEYADLIISKFYKPSKMALMPNLEIQGLEERAFNIIYKDVMHLITETNKFNYKPHFSVFPNLVYRKNGMTYCSDDEIAICHWCSGFNKQKPWDIKGFLSDKYSKEWNTKYEEFDKLISTIEV